MSTSNIRRVYHPEQLQYPSQAQIDECTTRTAELLGLTTTTKKQSVGMEMLSGKVNTQTQHVVHTSARTGQQRVIQIATENEDPFQMSKFKLKKVKTRPPSPPPTSHVDHSLTKTTQDELARWKIPNVVSNWTNASHLAVDLNARAKVAESYTQRINISLKHADFTTSLDDTMRLNRDEINARKELQIQAEEAMRQRELIKADQMSTAIHLGMAPGSVGMDPTDPRYTRSGQQPALQPTMGHDRLGDDDHDNVAALLQMAKNQQEREMEQKQAMAMEYSQQRKPQRDIGEVQTMTNAQTARTTNTAATGTYGGDGDGFGAQGSAGLVDDHVLMQANKGQVKHISEEEPYDGEFMDTSRSRQTYRTGATGEGVDEDGNLLGAETGGMGRGAMTRTTAVLFQKGATMAGNNDKPQQQQQPPQDENASDRRDRDRNYGK